MILPLVYTIYAVGAATLLNDLVQQFRMRNCQFSDLKIMVPFDKIEMLKKGNVSVCCKGSVGTIRGEFYVAGGHWDNIKPSSEENRTREVDVMKHLQELVTDISPKANSSEKKGRVGLFTYQNGINNSRADFENKCDLILENLPERPLSIGLFNPSNGKAIPVEALAAIPDLLRMKEELVYNTDTLALTWSFFVALAKFLPQGPKFFWTHICHSEGSILANLALTNKMTPSNEQEYFRNHLFVLTYGAVMPVPRRLVHKARNTYSEKDITWENYGKKLADNTIDYDIARVASIGTSFPLIAGDHDFLGRSYKTQLWGNLNDIRKEYVIS